MRDKGVAGDECAALDGALGALSPMAARGAREGRSADGEA
jgi:hypothetical protein